MKLRRLILPALVLLACTAAAATPLPSVSVNFGKSPSGPGLSTALQAAMVLTILTLAPTILMTMTSFTRMVVVMHFLRQGLGTQQTPSNQVLISLSLVLTFFVMGPTINEINTQVIQPLNRNELTVDQAFERTGAP
ncbi:MAG TPA: hypothetical protein VJ570_13405, partial [Holophagaceae bacterium]|nr:hypothetical protein [Holophagaceae bacterium]